MGFLFRFGFSMLLAWFFTPSVQGLIKLSGAQIDLATNSEIIFAATTLFIYLLSRILSPVSKTQTITTTHIGGFPQAGKTTSSITSADAEQIKSLLSSGNMIEAIKLIRRASNLGLKDAKDFAEQLKGGNFQSIAIQSAGFATDSDGKFQTIDITNPEDRIRRLEELKDKGLISQSEYEEKRKEILADL